MDEAQKTAGHLLEHASSTQGVAPRAIARALFMHEDAFATVLLLMVVDTYGKEALHWHPQTLKMQIEEDFGLQLPKENLDKIQAAICIVTTNYFYKSVARFIQLCNVLSGDDFQPDEFEPADAEEILWGITEAMLLCPPDDDPQDMQFTPEIREYIRKVLHEEGISHPPDVLRLGLDPSAAGKIDETFNDDPEMYSAVWKAQQGKTDDLIAMLKSNLSEMAQQLQLLPLENGSAGAVTTQILKMAGQLPVTQLPDTGMD